MATERDTDVSEFMTDLDGGALASRLGRIISEVAGAVVDSNKKGSISLQLNISRIGNSYQVAVDHKLTYTRPTANGKCSEEHKTSTPMHVNTGGRLTLFPENQAQMFTKTGEPATNKQD